MLAGSTECWLIVPEGNAKTTLVAGLALYHIQHKLAGEAPVAAAARDQAEILYRQAEGFVNRTPGLKNTFECLPGYRKIRCEAQGSRIQVFAADDRTGDGVIPTFAIIDEPHRQQNMRLYRTWTGKLAKRRGQIVAISTSGEPGSEFETTRERIRQTVEVVERTETFLRGRSPRLILHEWAVPEKGDVEDLELVKRANPLKAITVEDLRLKRESPTQTLDHWRRFVCNLPTRGINAAITEAEWHRAVTAEQIPPGQPIWLGLDVAWKWDTTAMVPFWMRDKQHRLFGPAKILTPPRDGNSLDPNLVERALVEIHHRNPLHTVVMDMSNAEQLASWIEAEFSARVVDRAQTNQFAAEDYSLFMEGLRNGWLKHSGDPGLTQHALNAVARILPTGDARFDRPSQTRQGGDQERRVIDALTAASQVHATAVKQEPAGVLMGGWV